MKSAHRSLHREQNDKNTNKQQAYSPFGASIDTKLMPILLIHHTM